MDDSAARPGFPVPTNGFRQRMTRDERRARIIEVATTQFARLGFEGATVAAIAAAAACSEPTLYKHFTDKRDLLLACLHETEDKVESEIQAIVDQANPLGNWTRYANESVDYRNMLMLRMLCSTFPADEEILTLLRGANQRMHERFGAAIERGKAEGTMRPDADAEYVTWLWLGMSLVGFQELAINGEASFLEASVIRGRLLVEALSLPANAAEAAPA
jgi:AcrR family transcriptional regulator